ncbi:MULTISPECIES: type 1 glutamine amidotransferase [Actinomyces]|uniref:Type 1 glutamine amidotransferase n=1 Tax=Actinomyces respiraculi TaxID=2744574 RepID=A0A7T0PX93_9ACTO|nr:MULTISPECIES: type 1 glutamine amidotransferase [Actinomyces]QPL05630.1 type 1 glutamine amidotransferase [Actinomyces respiraculi]
MTDIEEPLRQDSTGARSASAPVLTVIEPEAFAPLGRLGEWLFACGARLRVVRPWQGESIPDLADVGDGLVLLGGAMSAHDDDAHPWLADLRHLVRRVVEERVPTVAICLGAQVAAEALGGATAVPSPHGPENGVVDIELTEAATKDPFLAPIIDAAVRAAVRTGVPTQDGTHLPVIVSHADGVARLPEEATLLATSDAAPIHAWRVGRLLALQHHPESTPARIEHWQARNAAREMGLDLEGQAGETMDDADLPAEAVEAGRQARAEAERVDAVIQAFGRELARQLVLSARAYAVTRR